jgi:glyceraldehyde-3-phosphate dehydrogenase (ferredoxin)
MDERDRLDIHETFVKNHYLKQFNEETIKPKRQKTCGEPCVAVCKKLYGEFKKDYEPYQAMGPLAGIFDQRAAEELNHHADMYGFDGIAAGGVISWLMECVVENAVTPQELGIEDTPRFSAKGFDVVSDSMHNARIGIGLLDSIIEKRGLLDLEQGAREFAHRLSRQKGKRVLDAFVYTGFGRKGWMVPNQYWTPGVLSPMAIMGKYYMYYGTDFYAPRELGRKAAARLKAELILDNLGICRFHRAWAEEMAPEILEELYGLKERFLENIHTTACRINSRNASVSWESERSIDLVYTFLKRKQILENSNDAQLLKWLHLFETDRHEAALGFWYEMHKGIQETLKEF